MPARSIVHRFSMLCLLGALLLLGPVASAPGSLDLAAQPRDERPAAAGRNERSCAEGERGSDCEAERERRRAHGRDGEACDDRGRTPGCPPVRTRGLGPHGPGGGPND